MRVVLDTNVLISGIFWTGKPKETINYARKGKIVFLTSEHILKELKDVLTSKEKTFKLTKKDANIILNHLKKFGEICSVKSSTSICRHEADNRVLECAIDGKADYVITGDKHLLEIKEFKGIKIITVSEFLKKL